jgi:putative hydrolase of the HAD superfamily
MREWLDQADSLGLATGIASSSPRAWLVEHLSRAGVLSRFRVLAAGDEVANHKPAPDVYELALERLELSPGSAVAVEDTPHGVTAAHAAGMRCIAIPNPFVTRERVMHADLILDSARDIALADALAQVG